MVEATNSLNVGGSASVVFVVVHDFDVSIVVEQGDC